jgi:hypothetical protein
LDALIEASAVRQVFTLDVQLKSGEELHLATAPVTIGDNLYAPVLKEPGVVKLSAFADDDSQALKVSNVEYEFGQALTGAENALDGARATSGLLFVDDEGGGQWYDERMPGELLAGEVTEEAVSFDLVDELYAVVVAGERVVDVHPFRQPPAPVVRPDPNDTIGRPPFTGPGVTLPGGLDPGDDLGGRRGRFLMPVQIF